MRDYYHDTMTKASARVDKEVYSRVTSALHYGQITILIQSIFASIDQMIINGEIDKIIRYLYATGEITLTPINYTKEDK